MDPLKTGMVICEARKKLNMTQKDLADKLFVSDKAVSKWERGLCFPDISVLIPLTEILNISLYDLLRGEKMKKEEVEETLKNTIKYSNSELKKKKKKYIIIILIVILINIIGIVLSLTYFSQESMGIRYTVKHDKIADIKVFAKDITSRTDSNYSEKIENIFFDLALKYPGRNLYEERENDYVEIQYPTTYKNIVKIYKEETYVKKAIIYNSTMLFTSVSDLNMVNFKFDDYRYTIKRNDLLKVYNISNFDELLNEDNWENIVSKKLVDNEFLNNVFSNVFSKIKK